MERIVTLFSNVFSMSKKNKQNLLTQNYKRFSNSKITPKKDEHSNLLLENYQKLGKFLETIKSYIYVLLISMKFQVNRKVNKKVGCTKRCP